MNPAHRCRLFEPGWVYVPADVSDIRKTFERIRVELEPQKQPTEPADNVRLIERRAK